MRFVDKNHKKLPVTGKVYREADEGNGMGQGAVAGLSVQVSASGNKTWILRWSPEPYKQVQTRLGDCDTMTPTEARTKAKDIKEHGLPQEAAAVVKSKTVNDLLDKFQEDTFTELAESTRKEYIRFLKTKVREWVAEKDEQGEPVTGAPQFGTMDVRTVTGEHARDLLADCRKGASRTSAQVCIKMRECWEYAQVLGWIPDGRNLWDGQVKPPINEKDRRLTNQELVLLGQRLLKSEESEEYLIAYKLFLLAGPRHSNLAHCQWPWVDLENQWILVPWSEHKTGRKKKKPLQVLLSHYAVALLKRLKELQDADEDIKGTAYLYPAKGDPLKPRDDLQDPWERIRKDQSWEDVNIHDLRRTLSSVLSDLGYKAYADQILGHANKTVTDLYTRTSAEPLIKMLEEAGDRIVVCMNGKLPQPIFNNQPSVPVAPKTIQPTTEVQANELTIHNIESAVRVTTEMITEFP